MSSSINGEDMALQYLYVDNVVAGGEVEWGDVSFLSNQNSHQCFFILYLSWLFCALSAFLTICL